MRPSSPAEIRAGFDPVLVDGLANELHDLLCPHGRQECAASDRAKARFILWGFRERDWKLTR
jgi:endonuclease III